MTNTATRLLTVICAQKTGPVVFELELPAGATGGMVTYPCQGKQHIVFPIGTTGETPEILALSLP